MKYYLYYIALFALLFPSCKKKDTVDQNAVDAGIITQYISDNKLNATATGSGLYVVITSQGTGPQPSSNSNVTVNYKGYFTSGTVFDQSKSSGISFSLNGVIKGWQEGIPYFKQGGKGILLIPSSLGYGAQDRPSIPANSVLIFDIDLLDVK